MNCVAPIDHPHRNVREIKIQFALSLVHELAIMRKEFVAVPEPRGSVCKAAWNSWIDYSFILD